MARFCRDREFVLTFWKQASKDSSCPWVLRVYCINELAKASKVAAEFPPIPGTGQRNKAVEPNPEVSKDAPTELEVEASNAVADVKQFLKQLGGPDANS